MSDIIFNNVKHIGKGASVQKIHNAFVKEAKKQGCTTPAHSSPWMNEYRTPDPHEGWYKHCSLTRYNEETGDIEFTTQFLDAAHTAIDFSKDIYTDFMVYGEIKIPAVNNACFLVRMPKGRVPWSKKIIPAIRSLINSWDKDNRGKHWSVDGDNSYFIADGKMWDSIKSGNTLKYQWLDNKLVEVK